MLLAAALTMAPGYGRPGTEIQVDRLISQYEETMEPIAYYEWLKSQVSSEQGWDGVERRNDADIFRKNDQGVRAIRQGEHLYWMRDDADGSSFMAAFHTRGPLQGGVLRVRADGVEVHSSLYPDGSVLWAFVHPDGRVFRRKTNVDGSFDYSADTRN